MIEARHFGLEILSRTTETRCNGTGTNREQLPDLDGGHRFELEENGNRAAMDVLTS